MDTPTRKVTIGEGSCDRPWRSQRISTPAWLGRGEEGTERMGGEVGGSLHLQCTLLGFYINTSILSEFMIYCRRRDGVSSSLQPWSMFYSLRTDTHTQEHHQLQTHARTHAHTHTRTHAHTHANACTHSHERYLTTCIPNTF